MTSLLITINNLMKINAFLVSFCLLFFFPNASLATTKVSVSDTVCCAPQNLTLVSNTSSQFCVSWTFQTGSTCTIPYGFLLQWSATPTTNTRNEAVVLYNGSNIYSLCEALARCGTYQLRIKTLCDSSQTGQSSNWVYLQNVGVPCN